MSDILYEDQYFKVVREEASLPDGRTVTRSRIIRDDAVHIIAFKDDKTVLLLREYRPLYGEWVWMLPSGLVDKEKDIEVAAQRELREETGYRAENIEHFFSANQTEYFSRTNHVFIASDLHEDPLKGDDDEVIEVHEVPLKEALEGVSENRYKRHMITGYALLRYGMRIQNS